MPGQQVLFFSKSRWPDEGGGWFQTPDGAIRTSHLTSCVYNSPLSAIPHQLTRFKQSHLPRRNWLILFLPPISPPPPSPKPNCKPQKQSGNSQQSGWDELSLVNSFAQDMNTPAHDITNYCGTAVPLAIGLTPDWWRWQFLYFLMKWLKQIEGGGARPFRQLVSTGPWTGVARCG